MASTTRRCHAALRGKTPSRSPLRGRGALHASACKEDTRRERANRQLRAARPDPVRHARAQAVCCRGTWASCAEAYQRMSDRAWGASNASSSSASSSSEKFRPKSRRWQACLQRLSCQLQPCKPSAAGAIPPLLPPDRRNFRRKRRKAAMRGTFAGNKGSKSKLPLPADWVYHTSVISLLHPHGGVSHTQIIWTRVRPDVAKALSVDNARHGRTPAATGARGVGHAARRGPEHKCCARACPAACGAVCCAGCPRPDCASTH